jgi:hypothetical protein
MVFVKRVRVHRDGANSAEVTAQVREYAKTSSVKVATMKERDGGTDGAHLVEE